MKPRPYIACFSLALLVACGSLETLPLPNSVPPTAGGSIAEEREPAFVSFSELLIVGNYPTQVNLHVKGDLPTPCNQFRSVVAEPDAQKNIQVNVYSIVTTQAMCTQVLQSFDESVSIDMRNRFDATYTVYLNGQPAGRIIVDGNRISVVSQ